MQQTGAGGCKSIDQTQACTQKTKLLTATPQIRGRKYIYEKNPKHLELCDDNHADE